jgi:putative hydrolase of the HAD superfamily
MIRSFVFDIGNVLLPFDFGLVSKRLEKYCSTPYSDVSHRIDPLKASYEEGRIVKAEFVNQVAALLGFRGTEADLVAAWEDIFEDNEPMNRLVRALHGRYPLYLLSNTSDLHVDFILKRYPIFQCFSDAVYSYRAGCSKPGRAIFEVAACQFEIAPGETVFIDDLPANVEAALECGYQAIQYDFRNHSALLERLAKLGIRRDV